MTRSGVTRGLRERKKAATRLAIRSEAFRLFESRGYANTTVEQIADAAEISPSTFYRYFAVKEAVLLSDDHTTPIVDAFVAAPSHMTPVAAYRHAVAKVFGELSPEERDNTVLGQRLLYTVPEARGLVYNEYVRLLDLVADGLQYRSAAPSDPVQRRVIAGAIVGVLMAASHDNPLPGDGVDRALAILESRLH